MFYNEGWLLRLVLDWFERHRSEAHLLQFVSGSRWYSEALLPSQFFARYRGDGLAEGWTHADGVVGHLAIGDSAMADAKLIDGASQFVLLEAKLFSPLSRGVTHAKDFDQAARSVACMTEVLFRAKRAPNSLKSLAFFVVAPQEQIAVNLFAKEMSKSSMRDKVSQRIIQYDPRDRLIKQQWESEWFSPTLEHLSIDCLSWEDILKFIDGKDRDFGPAILEFYSDCLRFNRLQEPELVG
jgi:hypothetical protein